MNYKIEIGKSELESLIQALQIGAIYSDDELEKTKFRCLLVEFEDILSGKPTIRLYDILKPKNVEFVALDEVVEKK